MFEMGINNPKNIDWIIYEIFSERFLFYLKNKMNSYSEHKPITDTGFS